MKLVKIEKLKEKVPEYFNCPFSFLKEVEMNEDSLMSLMARSGKIIRFCCKKRIPGKPLWKIEKEIVSVITDNLGSEDAIIENLKRCKECNY